MPDNQELGPSEEQDPIDFHDDGVVDAVNLTDNYDWADSRFNSVSGAFMVTHTEDDHLVFPNPSSKPSGNTPERCVPLIDSGASRAVVGLSWVKKWLYTDGEISSRIAAPLSEYSVSETTVATNL